jgi:hypothetical protein
MSGVYTMKWNEMKVEVDGKVVCKATKDDKGVHIDCSEDCKKICEEFRCGHGCC